MINTRWRAGAAGMAGILAIAACSDTVTSPISPIAPAHSLRAVSAGGGAPKLIPNAVRYRQQTTPHATGRSGSAVLTARALMAKDGSTALEVTTGTLDAPGAPGDVTKLQVKPLDADGEALTAINFNRLTGGYQIQTFPGLARHQNVQVQGNVRGIDWKRTDVVTLTERVNLRPDIAILALTAPNRVKPNTGVIISATAAELNGDVGATSNCVLYVDGAETGRINGMWIADGDVVTCAFNTSFSTVGVYTLTVKAESVVPSDWDAHNNEMSRSIEVVNPAVIIHGSANVREGDHRNLWAESRTWSKTDGYRGTFSYRRDGWNQWQQSSMWGSSSTRTQVQFPLASVTYDITSDGVTGAILAASDVGDSGWGCAYAASADGYSSWANVCSGEYGYSFSAGHYAGVGVYYEHLFQESWDSGGYYYSYFYGPVSRPSQWGTFTPWGAQVDLKVRFTDAAGAEFAGHASIQLGPWQPGWGQAQPYTNSCTSSDDGYYVSYYCLEQEWRTRDRSGSATF